jgi:exopolysaccharide biosynthesis polyprenyl glycosylphosphotransferase
MKITLKDRRRWGWSHILASPPDRLVRLVTRRVFRLWATKTLVARSTLPRSREERERRLHGHNCISEKERPDDPADSCVGRGLSATEHRLRSEAARAQSLTAALDARALDTLNGKRTSLTRGRRGWLVRRMLLVADVVGLASAFLVAELLFGPGDGAINRFGAAAEFVVFLATLPLWVVVAKIYGLYVRDEERTDHSTVDDVVGVFHLVSVGTLLLFAASWLTNLAAPDVPKLMTFWALSIALITVGRAGARAFCRHTTSYLQNAVIVGAGEVGQLVARKLLQHPEYGIHLVGFVDSEPKERREDLAHVAVLGGPEELPKIVSLLDVERVIIAFSNESHTECLEQIRSLRNLGVQIDIVPRFFEAVGPKVGIYNIEGLPLIGLPPASLTRSSRLMKRSLDIAVAAVALMVTAPLFAYAAWRIKRESPGPVFFRQVRLGLDRREFTVLKFRTMTLEADDAAHREYIKSTMSSSALPGSNGLYKLERTKEITQFGHWLRKTSLDELPQLINVFRGEMSLVGPRPCLAYETEHFAPHHFERFLVPAGLTGLWQVTARAHSTFGEALDFDVAYARGWSLGLDLWLLCRTPLKMLRARETA